MKFACDAMLGKLAKWLRILGYDASYQVEIEDDELVKRARLEGRLILTRDTRLVKRLGEGEYLFIRDNASFDQLAQAVSELGLDNMEGRVLSRCTVCNEPLEAVPGESVQGLVPEYTFLREKEFHRCPSCGRAYWPGTHKARITEMLDKIKKRRA